VLLFREIQPLGIIQFPDRRRHTNFHTYVLRWGVNTAEIQPRLVLR